MACRLRAVSEMKGCCFGWRGSSNPHALGFSESHRIGDSPPPREEYWLRIDASQAKRVVQILGGVPAVAGETEEERDDGFACGDCGQKVATEEVFCPKCGVRFDD